MTLVSGAFQGNETNTRESRKLFLVLSFLFRKKSVSPALSSVMASCPENPQDIFIPHSYFLGLNGPHISERSHVPLRTDI